MHCQSARRYEMNGEAWLRTQFEPKHCGLGWRLSTSRACFCLLFALRMQLLPRTQRLWQTCETSIQTPGFFGDTTHWSKVLQLFFSSENEMKKLQKKTHNITLKMRKNIPVARARGQQDGILERASEASGQLRGLGQKVRAHGLEQSLVHVGQERCRALLLFVVFDTRNG